MPWLDKLRSSKRNGKRTTNSLPHFKKLDAGAERINYGNSTFPSLGAEQIRILLFQECEWRGRKLLFDSMKFENHQLHKNSVDPVSSDKEEKEAENGNSSLSEMAFGAIAMTYKGSSFKVHSLNSPPCVVCTKVFPALDHRSSKHSERPNEGGSARSSHTDCTTSDSSVRTTLSRHTDNSIEAGSSSELLVSVRKSSTCSSSGGSAYAAWDGTDLLQPQSQRGSSQSLESSSSSSCMGSLSSLRRRWLRAVSTSLNQTDSDDIFGIRHCGEGINGNNDKHYRSRLALTMLVRLNHGHERRIEARLLEHATLLEGMLDRLRYFCIERKGKRSADCIYKASCRFVLSLLRFLTNVHQVKTPLLWHDVLLNSMMTFEINTNVLHRGLHQMCQLLDSVDTKPTNFFLSTIVTAVLMYHLGWVHTVLPLEHRQAAEKLDKYYPCNPLWTQLGDLYGALSSPVKVTQTVLVGDSGKTELINSVLSFLSYFVRSGLIRKQQEYRCMIREDVEEATNLVEQAKAKRPYIFERAKSQKCASRLKRTSSTKGNLDKCEVTQPKYSSTESIDKFEKLSKVEKLEKNEKMKLKVEKSICESSKVTIIVSEMMDSCESEDYKVSSDMYSVTAPNVEKKVLQAEEEEEEEEEDENENKTNRVYFTLGSEEKASSKQKNSLKVTRSRGYNNCQCSYTFATVPSTSAQLPEDVLRKIIQRNFPESSKSVAETRPTSHMVCPRCQGYASSQMYKGTKELLETPTNATEVLRTCGNGERSETVGVTRSNSLEALMEANGVIELPMPRSRLMPSKGTTPTNEETGFVKTLLQTKVNDCWNSDYTWGLVVQGLIRKNNRKSKRDERKGEKKEDEEEWRWRVKEEIAACLRFPVIDQPVAEAVCILADLDTWHVGILSSKTPRESPPLPVGMSRLVSNMLEAFAYVWRKYQSPMHCVDILESKLREMWLRSEALAELLMTADACELNVAGLTSALDLDAADVPLLLAVATSHCPEIAQRFGLTLA